MRTLQIGIISLVVLLSATMSQAVSFDPPQFYTAGDGPSAGKCVDVDGDVDLDLVVTNGWSDQVAIYFNDGSAVFSAPVYYDVPLQPLGICAGDFDGDDDEDLATANHDSNNIAILMNNGDGTYAAPVFYGSDIEPGDILTVDLDGDADLDLACTNTNAATVTIYLNDGSGGFGFAGSYPVGTWPRWIGVGDFDEDGDSDLVTANNVAGTLSILFNDGNGGFGGRVDFPVGTYASGCVVEDYNGDEHLDIATAAFGDDMLFIFLGNGLGQFDSVLSYPTGDLPNEPAAADFDRDGDFDIVIPEGGVNGAVSLYLNDGSAGFTLEGDPVPVGAWPFGLDCADLNGDSAIDVLEPVSGDDQIAIFLNDATTFAEDWESAMDGWVLWGDPAAYLLEHPAGNHGIDPNGDGWCGSGAYYAQPMEWSPGAIFEFDINTNVFADPRAQNHQSYSIALSNGDPSVDPNCGSEGSLQNTLGVAVMPELAVEGFIFYAPGVTFDLQSYGSDMDGSWHHAMIENISPPSADYDLVRFTFDDHSETVTVYDRLPDLVYIQVGGRSVGMASSIDNLGYSPGSGPCELAILRPEACETFVAGEEMLIKWQVAGSCDSEATLELLQDGEVCQIISTSTANDGEFAWVVEMCAEGFDDYAVRITDLTSGVAAESEGTFHIVDDALFAEDWENGIDDEIWKSWGSPLPVVYPGEGRHESAGFDGNGDGNHGSGATTYQNFDVSLRPTFEFWANLTHTAQHHQNIRVGWSETTAENYGGSGEQPNWIISVYAAIEGEQHMIAYHAGEQQHMVPWDDADNGIWQNFRVEIEPCGSVAFFRGCELIWVSSPMDISMYTEQAFVAQGRSVGAHQIIDNIVIHDDIAITELVEDWEFGMDDWVLWGDPSAYLVEHPAGNYGIDPNGDGWCGSGAYYSQSLSWVPGAVLEFDINTNVFGDPRSQSHQSYSIAISNGEANTDPNCGSEGSLQNTLGLTVMPELAVEGFKFYAPGVDFDLQSYGPEMDGTWHRVRIENLTPDGADYDLVRFTCAGYTKTVAVYDRLPEQVYLQVGGRSVGMSSSIDNLHYYIHPVPCPVDLIVDTPPVSIALYQNAPNPLHLNTVISFDMSERARAVLKVFDVTGRQVMTLIDAELDAGTYNATWNGTNGWGERVSSGMYFYRLQVGRDSQTRKMLLTTG